MVFFKNKSRYFMVYYIWVFKLLDYIIKREDNKLYVCQTNQYFSFDITLQKYFNSRLINRLTNLDGVEKATKKLFGFKNKVPIFIDSKNLLMCIKSYRQEGSLYLNYHAILRHRIFEKEVYIEFHTGHCLRLVSRYAFLTQMQKCQLIIGHLQNHL